MLNNLEQCCYCFAAVSQHEKGAFHNMKKGRLELKCSMLDHNLDTKFQSTQAFMEAV